MVLPTFSKLSTTSSSFFPLAVSPHLLPQNVLFSPVELEPSQKQTTFGIKCSSVMTPCSKSATMTVPNLVTNHGSASGILLSLKASSTCNKTHPRQVYLRLPKQRRTMVGTTMELAAFPAQPWNPQAYGPRHLTPTTTHHSIVASLDPITLQPHLRRLQEYRPRRLQQYSRHFQRS